eukprot:TRINITY_DN1383_c0_g1_i1.p1 TRINITY_DN1383_c0_g1~~TRINITY_DN1383_c0_g1_i1.p1  ORF type:complete len:679 (+),score=95.20 TRINITY_DN1383_c0_g1_i1:281-2317(+)
MVATQTARERNVQRACMMTTLVLHDRFEDRFAQLPDTQIENNRSREDDTYTQKTTHQENLSKQNHYSKAYELQTGSSNTAHQTDADLEDYDDFDNDPESFHIKTAFDSSSLEHPSSTIFTSLDRDDFNHPILAHKSAPCGLRTLTRSTTIKSKSHGDILQMAYSTYSEEERVQYIESKTPRKLSTRDKYLTGDQNSPRKQQDPADQLKQQLLSMLVSNPEIEKRIQDVVSSEGDVDLATTTKTLDVKVDKTGAYCINQYIMIKTLGEGAIGTVKLCYNTMDKKLYAVKMIDRSKLNQQFKASRLLKKGRKSRDLNKQISIIAREIALLKKLEHHNIVKLHEVIDPLDENQPVMLVMEYLQEGPVVKQMPDSGEGFRFEQLPEELAAEYFRMMCNGLDYLHYNRIVHGDLKPDNLLIDDCGELKIADFGCARVIAEQNSVQNNRFGTPCFRAPEMQSGQSYDPFNADIWAMGVCLYVMVFGTLPFQGDSEQEVYHAIANQKLAFPDDVPVSPELRDLLINILQKDPKQRLSLYDIMQHDWVTDSGNIQLISLNQMTRPPSPVRVNSSEQLTAIAQQDDRMVRMNYEEKVFEDGEYLLRSGGMGDVLYFILSGAVEVRDPTWRNRSLCNQARESLTLERNGFTMLERFVEDKFEEDESDEEVEEQECGNDKIHLNKWAVR